MIVLSAQVGGGKVEQREAGVQENRRREVFLFFSLFFFFFRFLLVSHWSNWQITNSTTSAEYTNNIQSGRATNSPASPEAGSSLRLGQTNWSYWTSTAWKEADISVTCVE